MQDVTRREFLLGIGCVVPGLALLSAAANTQTEPRPGTDGGIDRAKDDISWQECAACNGLGRITCPACDGTMQWTEASERAGLHQREAARRVGRCAWSGEWGEKLCLECAGVGYRSRAEREKFELAKEPCTKKEIR